MGEKEDLEIIEEHDDTAEGRETRHGFANAGRFLLHAEICRRISRWYIFLRHE